VGHETSERIDIKIPDACAAWRGPQDGNNGGKNPTCRRRLCQQSYWILKSSMLLPSAIISIIQRGVFPRPDHVSEGSFGFRNFGSTLG
jgi:hypothetical protein